MNCFDSYHNHNAPIYSEKEIEVQLKQNSC
jgi:hypothetical protein